MSGIRHRTIDLDGPVHLLDAGDPDATTAPLLLVHGLDGSAANWWDTMPIWARDRHVVAVDLPGFGRSPVAGRSASVRTYADLVAEVARREFDRPPVIVGNSMGGVVVAITAARHPTAVAGVVLVAAAFPRAGGGPLAWSFLPALLGVWLGGRTVPRSRMGQSPEPRVRSLLDLCYAPGRRESDAAFAEMVDVARERPRADAVRAWTGAARSLSLWLVRRGAFHRAADRITVPVLVVDGGADPVIPTASVEDALQRHPAWQRVRLEAVGHVPQLEDPDATADLVTTFVDTTVAIRAP